MSIKKLVAMGLAVLTLVVIMTACDNSTSVVDDTTTPAEKTPVETTRNNISIPIEDQHKVIQMAAKYDFDIRDNGLGMIMISDGFPYELDGFYAVFAKPNTEIRSRFNYKFSVPKECFEQFYNLAEKYILDSLFNEQNTSFEGFSPGFQDNYVHLKIDQEIINQDILNEFLDILSPYATESNMIEGKDCISKENYNQFINNLSTEEESFKKTTYH